MDEAVAISLRENEEWHRRALPSFDIVQPRVCVMDGLKAKMRRPYRIRGEWWVRASGRGRLVNPRRMSGLITFDIHYGREKIDIRGDIMENQTPSPVPEA